jgi:cytochrome oxidase Cu insertion factor (SCO1/SenC/PrrC family)
VFVAVAAGVATWIVGRRRGDLPQRWRDVLGTADRAAEPVARRIVRIGFGALWLVDGLLQAAPDVPAGFRAPLAEGLAGTPGWYAAVVRPLADVWTRHPVVADASTVWVQCGLGVLILACASGPLLRAGLWTSILWSLVVWVGGEFSGGLFAPGAGWLTGAPGAVLTYVAAALLLLAPWSWWVSGRASRLARRFVGGWMLVTAGLQALPWEKAWTGAGLSGPFTDAAGNAQPSLLSSPITSLADLARHSPVVVNGMLLAALMVIGAGLVLSRSTLYVGAGVALCALTWWLAQDFGVLEPAATDPNTALPLGLLLVSALPGWRTAGQPAVTVRTRTPAYRDALIAAVAAVGLGAVLAPLLVTGTLLGPADAAAVAADSEGGLTSLPPRRVPDFRLVDQAGRTFTRADLRGTLTVITFLDPVCSDECPVIASQLALADHRLGSLASRIQIVAIDSNPVFTHVSDVASFTRSHGLTDLTNWHFLAGSSTQLQDLLAAYGIAVQVPAVGMIAHDEGIYFVGPDLRTASYLHDGATVGLTGSYADAVAGEVRALLARTGR